MFKQESSSPRAISTVHNTDKLTLLADVQAFSLLAYADIPKENDSYSVLFYVGVVSCIYDLHANS